MKLKYYTILALFAFAAAFTFFCRVERRVQARTINLAAVPTVIGDWRMVDQDASIGKNESTFLDEVLVRTYQRPDGKTVSLSIAYGVDQRKRYTIHLPEVCYKASGCDVSLLGQSFMKSPNLRLKRMVAKSATGETESVQYWIVLGGKVVTGDYDRKLKQAYYNFFGAEAGGVLMRVSSLSAGQDYKKEYEVQREFISALYNSLNPELKKLFFGNINS